MRRQLPFFDDEQRKSNATHFGFDVLLSDALSDPKVISPAESKAIVMEPLDW